MRTGRDGHRPSAVRRGATGLLVRHRGEDHVAPEGSGPLEPDHDRKLHGHHVLHVHRAPAPDHVVDDVPAERVQAHADASTRTTSRWLSRTSGGSGLRGRVGRQPREAAAPARDRFEDLGRDPCGGRAPRRSSERRRFRRRSCPAQQRGRVARRVDRWDANEGAEVGDRLVGVRPGPHVAHDSEIGAGAGANAWPSARSAFAPVRRQSTSARHADVGCEQEDRGQKQDGAGRRGP